MGEPDPPRTYSRRQVLEAGLAVPVAVALGNRPRDRAAPGPDPSSEPAHLTILHTADIHGQVDPHDEFFWENDHPVFRRRGGFATLKTMVSRIRREAKGTVLLVDSGDCFHGSALVALSDGAAIVPLVNALGYDLMLPGNWEVVYGKAALLRDFAGYRASAVCANMYHDAPGPARLLFPPFHVFELGPIRLGVIGYNDPLTAVRQSPAYSTGIRFAKPEATLARHVRILRGQHRCNVVCVLSHLGLAQQVALADRPDARGLDYVLGGDTHERTRQPIRARHARVTEPGAFGSFLGRLDLTIANGTIVDERYELLDVDPERYGEDPAVRELVATAKAPHRAELDRVVGRTTTPLFRYYVIETPLDNLITDALEDRFHTDFVVSNGFRFCPPLAPKPGEAADITMDYLWSMLPVDSTVKTARVTGEQVLDWLERELENVFATDPAQRFGGWLVRFKGMKLTFRVHAPKGQRVASVTIRDRPLDPSATYSMLACEREGDPDTVLCRMKGVGTPERLDVKLHEVIAGYLERASPVAPAVEGRAVPLDASPQLLSQIGGYRFS